MQLDDRPAESHPARPTVSILVVLLLTLASAFFLYQKNSNFDLEYHSDEHLKVTIAMTHHNTFRHPLLLIRSLQMADLIADTTEPQKTVELGRKVSAIYGTIFVLSCFLLFRELTSDRNAIVATIVAAFVPNIVVHAHYLKEDIYLIPFLMLSLRSLIRYLRSRGMSDLVMMGVFAGLAGSTKYLGLTMLVFFVLLPRLVRIENPPGYLKRVCFVAIPVAAAVFLLINVSMADSTQFVDGLYTETRHAALGHRLAVFPWSQYFSFHFFRSVIPGMGWSLVIPGIMTPILMWRRKVPFNTGERALLAAGILFYVMIETTPLKPWPDFMRYAMPVVPVLAYFAVRGVSALTEKVPNPTAALILFVSLLAALPIIDSWKLVKHLNRDTRAALAERFPENDNLVFAESYTLAVRDGVLATRRELADFERLGTRYVLTSSFNYDRYFLGETLRFQSPDIYVHAERYRRLFEHCQTEDIAPAYKTFAFSNPTIRIVSIGECSPDLSLPAIPGVSP